MTSQPYTYQELEECGLLDPVPLTEEETKTMAGTLREQALEAERKGQLLLAHQKRKEAANLGRDNSHG